jgi:hypothetical protein
MNNVQDWRESRITWIRLLEQSTGEDLESWNLRIQREGLYDEQSLRSWLTQQGVTGYAQSLLVMERFGYPNFITASAEELIDGQYADRPQLQPIFDAVVNTAIQFGEVIIQARKTYVSLVAPRRTFARVQPTTKTRLDLGLRLEGQKPEGRLQPSNIHETMRLQISLSSVDQFDSEVVGWLRRAYEENC